MTNDDRRGLAVATVTLVRDPDEGVLLRGALTMLSRSGLPVVVADGGSGDEFVEFVGRLPHFTTVRPASPGLVPQVQAALTRACALGSEFLLYTESDKHQFFSEGLDAFLGRAPLAPGTGVVLAARSQSSYDTFPPLQRFAEVTINTLTGQFVGRAGDYSYGPFLMHRSLVPHLAAVPAAIGWGWRHCIFSVAHRLGLQVVHLEGDHACPEDQRHEDDGERIHRLRQLAQNVNGLLLGMTSPVE